VQVAERRRERKLRAAPDRRLRVLKRDLQLDARATTRSRDGMSSAATGFPGPRPRGRGHDGGHLTVADLDRERIIRKPVLGGLINEYARAPPNFSKNRRSRCGS
jgi:hypothetical protein